MDVWVRCEAHDGLPRWSHTVGMALSRRVGPLIVGAAIVATLGSSTCTALPTIRLGSNTSRSWTSSSERDVPGRRCYPPPVQVVPTRYREGTIRSLSIQIAVRLPEDLVAFIDELVANGRAASRAEVVSRAVQREHRHEIAASDAAILAKGKSSPDLDRLGEFVVGLRLDID